MGSVQDKKLIVGLDIGTSKVVAIVGEIGLEGGIEIVGIGSNPSKGRLPHVPLCPDQQFKSFWSDR